jgi:hypothetical protein
MFALYQYVCALPICLHFIKPSAVYWNVSALLKCWRFLEMLALYWNVGDLLKCWWTTKMLVPHATSHVKIYESCKGWPSPYCLAWQNSKVTTPPLLSLVALSLLLKVYSRPFLVQLLSASLYGWTTLVPGRHGRTSQMFAFYSNFSALPQCRRPIENHWKWAVYNSATRHDIKKR